MAFGRLRAATVLAVLAQAFAQNTPPTIAGSTPGPPPDVVALFTGQNSVGGVAASGAFFVQETGSVLETSSGVYLSHKCNADGSWDSVWALSNYTSTGATYPQVYYCKALAQPWYRTGLAVASTDMGAAGTGEHGSINATTFVVSTYFAQTTTCPLTSTAGATLLNTTEDTNSNLGALLQTPYCNSAIANSDLVHASALSAPAPGPDPSGSGDGSSDYDSGGSRRLLSSKRA